MDLLVTARATASMEVKEESSTIADTGTFRRASSQCTGIISPECPINGSNSRNVQYMDQSSRGSGCAVIRPPFSAPAQQFSHCYQHDCSDLTTFQELERNKRGRWRKRPAPSRPPPPSATQRLSIFFHSFIEHSSI